MYNCVIIQNKENDTYLKFLFTKKEFQFIKNYFFWEIGPEGFIINSEDHFTGKQLKEFVKLFPYISEDYSIDDNYISFHSGIYFFQIKEYLNEKFYPFEKGACNCIYAQLTPINGRPRFTFGDSYIVEWFHEFGLYKKKSILDTSKTFFIHPFTRNYTFDKKEDYIPFIEKVKKEKEKMENLKHDKNQFIRVINVYDKLTQELKYRIINEEFLSSGLDTVIKPFENDDVIFMRSYRIDEEIAAYIIRMFEKVPDFNFERNEYYLETLAAKDFIYDYKDFADSIDIND